MLEFMRLIGVPEDWPMTSVMGLLERHPGDLVGLFEEIVVLKSRPA